MATKYHGTPGLTETNVSVAARIVQGEVTPECLPREIFRHAGARDDVVFDAYATERLELRDPLPVDRLADGLRLRFVEQLVDEVEPRLDRHHEAILELARQAQERMVVRPLDFAAAGVALLPADIVHLQA